MKFSNENKKIGRDTLIFNITSSTDCPAKKLGMCTIAKRCYAMKAERLYPNVLPYRRNQTKSWDVQSADDIAWDIYYKTTRNNRSRQIKYIRFSESGDFRNQNDVEKIKRIASLLPHLIIRKLLNEVID